MNNNLPKIVPLNKSKVNTVLPLLPPVVKIQNPPLGKVKLIASPLPNPTLPKIKPLSNLNSNLPKIISKSPWDFFDNVKWKLDDDELDYEKYVDLGNDVNIGFPVDKDEKIPLIIRNYKTKTFFTPSEILNFIFEFYQEPISLKELEEQKKIGNPHALSWHDDNAKILMIFRIDMFPEDSFFKGFKKEGIFYKILF